MKNKDFVAFILSHGRADRVFTYTTLRKRGYSGRVVVVIDNEDSTAARYKENFGEENVVVFDKAKVAETFDEGLKGDRRTIVYARNACFQIARDLGYRYFIELDDDYVNFHWRFDNNLQYKNNQKSLKNMDRVLDIMLNYYKSAERITSIAMAQGGDFIGGDKSGLATRLRMKRKAMNSFICDTERQFTFLGRINEDVNTYTRNATTGELFFQIHQCALEQTQTQKQDGGMTEVYLDSGTYIKSFFSVMYLPSAVRVKTMGNEYIGKKRLHHLVNWKYVTPKILREEYKKKGEKNNG